MLKPGISGKDVPCTGRPSWGVIVAATAEKPTRHRPGIVHVLYTIILLPTKTRYPLASGTTLYFVPGTWGINVYQVPGKSVPVRTYSLCCDKRKMLPGGSCSVACFEASHHSVLCCAYIACPLTVCLFLSPSPLRVRVLPSWESVLLAMPSAVAQRREHTAYCSPRKSDFKFIQVQQAVEDRVRESVDRRLEPGVPHAARVDSRPRPSLASSPFSAPSPSCVQHRGRRH